MSGLILVLLGLATGPVEPAASFEFWRNIGRPGGLEFRNAPQVITDNFASQCFGRLSGLGIRGDLYCGRGVHVVVAVAAGPSGFSAVPGVQLWPIQGVELSFGIDVIRGRQVGGISYWASDPGALYRALRAMAEVYLTR